MVEGIKVGEIFSVKEARDKLPKLVNSRFFRRKNV